MKKEPELDTLFATPPDRFVAVRKELATAAKQSGRSDLAIRLSSLKRPSPVVWLANALAREHPDELAAVLDAGAEIRSAYQSGEVGRIREATQRRQQAISAALRAARSLGADRQAHGERGPAADGANDRKLARTLLAASIDAPQGELLARGRLEHEIEPPPFEGMLGEPPKLRPKANAATGSAAAKREAEASKAHAKELRALERTSEKAELEAVRLEKLAGTKRARAVAAQRASEDAAAAAREARKVADEERRKLESFRRSSGPR